MPKILATISQITSTATELENLNTQFGQKVTELAALESELGAMWQGEANNAFRTAFNNDRDKWAQFQQIISQYIQALRNAAERLANAEETNKDTATRRSY